MTNQDYKPFSERLGVQPGPKEITVRYDAPTDFRYAVVSLAGQNGLCAESLRGTVCSILLVRPDADNWSSYNVYSEAEWRVDSCEWFQVYDIAEAFYQELKRQNPYEGNAASYEKGLNRHMEAHGVGWQMTKGIFLARGSEALPDASISAEHELQASGRITAAAEMREALADISRRPEADRTGAIQHAMAAMECLLKDLTNEPKKTLGEVLKIHGESLDIPAPLDEALKKMWGYASETGRHLREGREPRFEEAELVVTTSAALCSYLSKRKGSQQR